MNSDRVFAVVVAHNADRDFLRRLKKTAEQVSRVVVVDNASISAGPLPSWVHLFRNSSNLGIGRALNQGFEIARREGARWVVALDQDSLPGDEMVPALLQAFENHPRRDELAIVAPRLTGGDVAVDARYVRRVGPGLFRRVPCSSDVVDDVTFAITSGSLLNLDACKQIGPFREDFFIDYVDTEYCLRAQMHGYRIAVACKAVLHHRLGARRHASLVGLDFYPTFHSPERWYYMGRNRIPMIRMYAWRFPHWFTYEAVASIHGFLRMLAFEDRRREKLIAVWKGTIDGLLGRLGPGPLGAP